MALDEYPIVPVDRDHVHDRDKMEQLQQLLDHPVLPGPAPYPPCEGCGQSHTPLLPATVNLVQCLYCNHVAARVAC